MEDDENFPINYRLIIENFETKYVKDIFNNYKKDKPNEGYLINLENYEDLKNKIKTYSIGDFNASHI